MLKGYTAPRTPKGSMSLVPYPPWHYIGNVMAIEYEADRALIESYLPEPLALESTKCCIYFVDWQYTSENDKAYLDPVKSQYKETIILMSASYKGTPMAYCPYIWVSQDKAFLRGLIQGWPKQIGETYMSKMFSLESKAAPTGDLSAMLTVNGRCYIKSHVQLNTENNKIPSPTFAGSALLRYFPNLVLGKHQQPMINELVRLKSRDVNVSSVSRGNAKLEFEISSDHELSDFAPIKVLYGYQFEVALTVDDLEVLEKL